MRWGPWPFHRIRDIGEAIQLRQAGDEVWLIHGDDAEPDWEDDQPAYVWVVSAEEAKGLIVKGYEGYPIFDLDDEAPPPRR